MGSIVAGMLSEKDALANEVLGSVTGEKKERKKREVTEGKVVEGKIPDDVKKKAKKLTKSYVETAVSSALGSQLVDDILDDLDDVFGDLEGETEPYPDEAYVGKLVAKYHKVIKAAVKAVK